MKLIRKGKVKDIYQLEDGNILFHFSDRISAFDVKMATSIPRKGEVLCRSAEFWFDSLETSHHMLGTVENERMIVKKLDMIPIECVVRGYLYGSIVDRFATRLGKDIPDSFEPLLATQLPTPLFDPTTKSEEHDVPISKEEAISSNIIQQRDYDYLEQTSISLYKKMSKIVEQAGFIIADVKFEFGRDTNGNIILADSLGPDEYRLWLRDHYQPGKMQESYDKQLLRDWLVQVGFKQKIDDLAKVGKKPSSPELPEDLVQELSKRYIFTYERISGHKL
jgi:phosphoribosylaminoimidazole-succinocarboxamide synthase